MRVVSKPPMRNCNTLREPELGVQYIICNGHISKMPRYKRDVCCDSHTSHTHTSDWGRAGPVAWCVVHACGFVGKAISHLRQNRYYWHPNAIYVSPLASRRPPRPFACTSVWQGAGGGGSAGDVEPQQQRFIVHTGHGLTPLGIFRVVSVQYRIAANNLYRYRWCIG